MIECITLFEQCYTTANILIDFEIA